MGSEEGIWERKGGKMTDRIVDTARKKMVEERKMLGR